MQIVNHCSLSEIYNKSSVSHFPRPCIFDIIRHCSSEKKPIKTQNPKKPTRVFLNTAAAWYDQVAGCGGPKPTTTTC